MSEYVIAKTRKTGKYYVRTHYWTDDKRFDTQEEAFARATELKDRDDYNARFDIDLA